MANCTAYFSLAGDYYMPGCIIPETTLELKKLERKLNQLQLLKASKEEKFAEYKLQIEDEKKAIEEEYERKFYSILKKMNAIYARMHPLNFDLLWWSQAIRWDRRCTVKVIQGNNPYLENFSRIQFTAGVIMQGVIPRLFEDLLKEMPSEYTDIIRQRQIEEFTRQVKSALKIEPAIKSKEDSETLQQVELCASFICLDRVQSYGPLSIRNSKAVLNEKLIENAFRLYVITECLLGGLFLGYRTHTTAKTSNLSVEEIAIISKGTISPIIPGNLNASYRSWKESLLNNHHAGYPIAYKVKSLKEILK